MPIKGVSKDKLESFAKKAKTRSTESLLNVNDNITYECFLNAMIANKLVVSNIVNPRAH